MAEKKFKPHECAFFVRQSGLEYGPEHGAIVGFADKKAADENCADRNSRAKEMGLKARYEVVAN